MKLLIKKFLHVAGSFLAVIAIFFVIVRFRSYLSEVNFSTVVAESWPFLVIMSLCYGISGLFLAKIWGCCLEYLEVRVNFLTTTWVYGYSQLGKYIPGNIFHLAGRQALGMAENLPAGKTMKSLVWELGILAIGAAGLFCPVFIAYFLFPFWSTSGFVGIFIFCCVTVPWLVGRLLGEKIRAAILWCLSFLCIMGAIFVVLLLQITAHPLNLGKCFILAGGYVVAWFIGLMTPGAPAGMGMREATMLLLTRGMPIPEADLLLAVVLCRIVTTAGDFLFFLGSICLKYIVRRRLCSD